MNPAAAPAVHLADYAREHACVHAVRSVVFVQEQQVPVELERDALDPVSIHVLARAGDGTAVGTARMTPDRRIGRMAVLPAWRGRGVGQALMDTLLAQARALGWPEVSLHAQLHALPFYARSGFVPAGARFSEAGIDHRRMVRRLPGASPIEDAEAAAAVVVALATHARRGLAFYSRALDPGLLDRREVLDAIRRFATRTGPRQVRILLHDADSPRREDAPLLGLAQRLPSVFSLRQISDPVDARYPSAYAFNDRGGALFRPLASRMEGEGGIDDGATARRLEQAFTPVWERSRPCTELRALG